MAYFLYRERIIARCLNLNEEKTICNYIQLFLFSIMYGSKRNQALVRNRAVVGNHAEIRAIWRIGRIAKVATTLRIILQIASNEVPV